MEAGKVSTKFFVKMLKAVEKWECSVRCSKVELKEENRSHYEPQPQQWWSCPRPPSAEYEPHLVIESEVL